jgi:hypothetical protein
MVHACSLFSDRAKIPTSAYQVQIFSMLTAYLKMGLHLKRQFNEIFYSWVFRQYPKAPD